MKTTQTCCDKLPVKEVSKQRNGELRIKVPGLANKVWEYQLKCHAAYHA